MSSRCVNMSLKEQHLIGLFTISVLKGNFKRENNSKTIPNRRQGTIDLFQKIVHSFIQMHSLIVFKNEGSNEKEKVINFPVSIIKQTIQLDGI